MVESKWILTLKRGFAPSTHFASTLDCCEQTTFKHLASDRGEQVVLCGQTPAQKVRVGWRKGDPQWHGCSHGRTEGSTWEHACRAYAYCPVLHHVQQPSPACHRNMICNLYNHRQWNESAPSPTPLNSKLWGLHCCEDLSSHAEHKHKARTYSGNKKLSFSLCLSHFKYPPYPSWLCVPETQVPRWKVGWNRQMPFQGDNPSILQQRDPSVPHCRGNRGTKVNRHTVIHG